VARRHKEHQRPLATDQKKSRAFASAIRAAKRDRRRLFHQRQRCGLGCGRAELPPEGQLRPLSAGQPPAGPGAASSTTDHSRRRCNSFEAPRAGQKHRPLRGAVAGEPVGLDAIGRSPQGRWAFGHRNGKTSGGRIRLRHPAPAFGWPACKARLRSSPWKFNAGAPGLLASLPTQVCVGAVGRPPPEPSVRAL